MRKSSIIIPALLLSFSAIAQTAKEKIPPPPPPPPPPPVEAIKFTPPKIVKDLPAPPKPPKAPMPPKKYYNKKGYNISVISVNEEANVIVQKSNFKKTIKMSDWMADEKVYEARYGKLPPPPPPPPPLKKGE